MFQIKVFVTEILKRSQGELYSHKKIDDEKAQGGKEFVVNKTKLLVLAGSACLQLIVWAALDEMGGF